MKVGVFLAVHEIDLPLAAVLFGEIALMHLILVINALPLGVESERVYKYHHRGAHVDIRAEYVGYHTVGMFIHPTVYILPRAVVKGSLVNVSSEIVRVLLEESFIHGEAVVRGEPDGIRKIQLILFAVNELRGVVIIELVQLVDAHSEHVFHLRKRLALGAVRRHRERGEHGERRNERVLALLKAGLEQPHGKIRRLNRAGRCGHDGRSLVFRSYPRHEVDRLYRGGLICALRGVCAGFDRHGGACAADRAE